MIIENKVPANMPIPPKEGVLTLWDRRSPGSSIRFFLIARWMIDGIARYVNANEVMNASIISYITKSLTGQIYKLGLYF